MICDINTTLFIGVKLVLTVTLPVMAHAVKLDLPHNQSSPPPVQP